MRILLTNDDGIYAKGIEVLHDILMPLYDICVVAPETEQSAVGHAITFLDPLRVKPIKRNGDFFGYAVNGTPADCVKLAIRELMDNPPDMVISGVNLGANVGENVIYSGTVSAATEASMLGFSSMAVSIDAYPASDFSAARKYVPMIVERLRFNPLSPGISLNVNIPHIPASDIRGIRVAHQGHLRYKEAYDRRVDPRNRVYYWLCSQMVEHDTDPESDSYVLAQGYITLTPIHYDLTHYAACKLLKKLGWEDVPQEGSNAHAMSVSS